MLTIDHSACSDRGRVREENQDAWFASEPLGLFGVSDGMGGHAAGALASRIVAETMPGFLKKHLRDVADLRAAGARESVRSAVVELSDAVAQESRGRSDLIGMGATVVFAVVRDDVALIAHLGDSRAYLLRDGELRLVTTDHNLAEVIQRSDSVRGEAIDREHGKSTLTRFIGMQDPPVPDVSEPIPLQPDDRWLLCTDGLFNHVEEETIQTILQRDAETATAAERLVATANHNGGSDNITALVLRVAKTQAAGECV